ncbi:MAG: hypothetical protein KatS3mg068_1132 [Candidatus Sericytochromatia bacterium]|nr:MAG: hypothetical protein KatS3mg068_1132 [Candidatus Sericytochromatia bacterium]
MIKIKKFLSRTKEERKIFLITLFYMIYTQALIKLIPFKFIIKILSLKICNEVSKNLSPENNIKEIKWAINVCSKIVFWKSKCLNQALTAYKVLKTYNNNPYLYLGLIKENNKLEAHAWTIVNDVYITGKDNRIYDIICIFK